MWGWNSGGLFRLLSPYENAVRQSRQGKIGLTIHKRLQRLVDGEVNSFTSSNLRVLDLI